MQNGMPDKGLLDTAYDAVKRTPHVREAVDALDFVFSVWAAQMHAWLTEHRLELAREWSQKQEARDGDR